MMKGLSLMKICMILIGITLSACSSFSPREQQAKNSFGVQRSTASDEVPDFGARVQKLKNVVNNNLPQSCRSELLMKAVNDLIPKTCLVAGSGNFFGNDVAWTILDQNGAVLGGANNPGSLIDQMKALKASGQCLARTAICEVSGDGASIYVDGINLSSNYNPTNLQALREAGVCK